MGSCVSMHKDPKSVKKIRFTFGSRNEKLLIPSPVKEMSDMVNVGDLVVPDVAVKSKRSPDSSKDEAFFDSQPWLESDCEDDFLSVNGDFTPSRGNTPVHHSFSLGNLHVNKVQVEGTRVSASEPSPPDKKKKLSELFKESLRDDEYVEEDPVADEKNKVPANLVGAATSLVQQPKSKKWDAPHLQS